MKNDQNTQLTAPSGTQRFRPNRSALAGVAGFSIILSACGAADFVSEQSSSADQRLGQYIESCSNSTIPNIGEAAAHYAEWTEPTGGPTLESASNGVRPIASLELCARAIESAGDSTEPVDVAAAEFLADAEALGELVDAADIYYTTRNYETDDLAEGVELHPQLLAAYETTLDSAESFASIANEINDAQFEKELADAAEGDRDVEDMVRLTIDQAEAVIDSVVVDGFVASPEQASPELAEALRTETLALRELIDEMKAAADEQEEINLFNYDGYERQLELYIAEAELLQVRLDRPEFFTQEELDDIVFSINEAGTFNTLLEGWNTLVNSYNRLG